MCFHRWIHLCLPVALCVFWPSLNYADIYVVAHNHGTSTMWITIHPEYASDYQVSLTAGSDTTILNWPNFNTIVTCYWYTNSARNPVYDTQTWSPTVAGQTHDFIYSGPSQTFDYWYTHVQWTNAQPTWAIVDSMVTDTNGTEWFPTNFQARAVAPFGVLDFWFTNTTTGGTFSLGDTRKNDVADFTADLTHATAQTQQSQSSNTQPPTQYSPTQVTGITNTATTSALTEKMYYQGTDAEIMAIAEVERAIRDQIAADATNTQAIVNASGGGTNMQAVADWTRSRGSNETAAVSAINNWTNVSAVASNRVSEMGTALNNFNYTNSIASGASSLSGMFFNGTVPGSFGIVSVGNSNVDLKPYLSGQIMETGNGGINGLRSWLRSIAVWGMLVSLIALYVSEIREALVKIMTVPQTPMSVGGDVVTMGVQITVRSFVVMAILAVALFIPSIAMAWLSTGATGMGITNVATALTGGGGGASWIGSIPSAILNMCLTVEEYLPYGEAIFMGCNLLLARMAMDLCVSFSVVYGKALGI